MRALSRVYGCFSVNRGHTCYDHAQQYRTTYSKHKERSKQITRQSVATLNGD
ncbi:hypothetical protein K227x_32450 [Rubripirellula lacrimiformis]|uniref:Uncharacterized protein n=1 Tax=Rubripirellula lacrimiformis TaxID=1930273 RepID=A0A517NCS1_9BACT|nr:hypothetical protein K227x_32450 [Rubripirellula lacrimiformis]